MRKLIRKILSENKSDDFKWIEDIKPYISFGDIHNRYPGDVGSYDLNFGVRIKDRDAFIEMTLGCNGDEGEWIDDIVWCRIEGSDYLSYDSVFCGQWPPRPQPHSTWEWEGQKVCLGVYFYDKNNVNIADYWVSDDMIELYHMTI